MFKRMNVNFRRVLLVLGCLPLAAAIAFAQTDGAGNAYSFNGTTANYISDDAFSNFPSNAITIEFWMRTSDTTKAGTPFSYAVSGEDNMLFIHDYRDLRFRLGGTAIPASGGTGVAVNNNQWRHVAMIWRNNGSFILYIDGVQRYSAGGIRPGFLIPSGGTMVIGQEQDSVGGGFQATEAFLGQIDELRIWNIQRTEPQIRDNRHRSLPGNTASLVLYYRMDETGSGLVNDSTGNDHVGTLIGAARVTSSAPVGLPVVANTTSPGNIGTTSAEFRGTIDPNGLASVGYFEWGTSAGTLGNFTPQVNVGNGSTSVTITHTLTGLQPSSPYYVRAVGSSILGESIGFTYGFTTLGPPVVTTGPATSVTGDSGTLNGTVNPRGYAGYTYFEYGVSTTYGFTSPTSNFSAGLSDTNFALPITGLTSGFVYHYRMVAVNGQGTSYGEDRVFLTLPFGEAVTFTSFHYTDVAWGDYNRDRNLDLILTGTSNGNLSNSFTRVFRNVNGTFTQSSPLLPSLAFGLARWADFDKDANLDLLIMGQTDPTNRICQIRRGNGAGSFTDINADIPGMSHGAAAWGDYDRDGDLDLFVTGTTNGASSAIRSRLLRNNGDGSFSVGPNVPAVMRGGVAWADIDHDGDLDLAIAGQAANNTLITYIYRNVGNSFTFVTNSTGVRDASVAWGDYDNDGDPDLVFTGTTNLNGAVLDGVCEILRNDGASFARVNAGLPGVSGGNAAWGDYDNDGDLDLAIAGTHTTGTALTQLYANNGDHTFTARFSMGGINLGSVAWGDFDNDGDLDLALVGTNQSGAIAQIRQNDSFPVNTVPTAPSNLIATSTPTSATFSWDAASDAQTPANGLTYNLRVSNSLVDPQADLTTGYRRVPEVGNVQQGTAAMRFLTNFPGGTYTWTVQAIDSAFAGGPFATNGVLHLVGRPDVLSASALNVTTDSATLRAFVNPGGRNTTMDFDFGESPSYGTQLGSTNVGNGFSNVVVNVDVEGLLPDTVYYFRANALNVLGADTGADVQFRTLFFSMQPSPLEVSLRPGASAEASITLSNHIASAVNVTNRFRPTVPTWAAVLTPTFVLDGNSTEEIDVLFDATGLSFGTHAAVLEILSGASHTVATVSVRLHVVPAEPADISFISLQPNGSMLLDFDGTSGYTQTVMASTNLQDWTAIGPATQVSPGRFQFTDPAATNFTQRFYKIRTP